MERRWPILYCERGDLSLWAEPLNTLSNLAFLAAALLALWTLRRSGLREPWLLLLIGLTLAIFIGSTAFHALPNRITVLMDVIPIQLFMLAYLALALRRFLGLHWIGVALGLGLFIAVVALLPLAVTDRSLASIAAYLAALAALIGVGAAALSRQQRAGLGLLAAGAVFAGSLTARQLDLPWCPVLPIGTHWLWHLANGLVLGILLLTAIGQAMRHANKEAQ